MRSPNWIPVMPLYRLREEHAGELAPEYELGLDGPLCDVEVGMDEEYLDSYALVGLEPGVRVGKCLFDTGADNTAIDLRVAEQLNLKSVGSIPVQAAFGGGTKAPKFAMTLKLKGYEFMVFEAPAFNFEREGFIAIIGRDILHCGYFEYFGRDGHWGFEVPVTPG